MTSMYVVRTQYALSSGLIFTGILQLFNDPVEMASKKADEGALIQEFGGDSGLLGVIQVSLIHYIFSLIHWIFVLLHFRGRLALRGNVALESWSCDSCHTG